ncbi:hypothetical protein EVAR_19375_1 [Eumeta japonica]|uniref:Uncharacterized protein n=1 Tax=Eumeta variegata TaxID=151549 RepID=A0A4C1TRF9_EUMVA|nr:hypothetical protein EVAR_19375_1 [Eumeta japonica]
MTSDVRDGLEVESAASADDARAGRARDDRESNGSAIAVTSLVVYKKNLNKNLEFPPKRKIVATAVKRKCVYCLIIPSSLPPSLRASDQVTRVNPPRDSLDH